MKNTSCKRLLSAALACAMLAGNLPASSRAEAPAVLAAASGTCGENASWKLENGTLTISGFGDMTNFGWDISSPWASIRDSITGLVIDPRITSIGDFAFSDCSNLTSVTIPEGVISIGNSAFHGCSLQSLHLPKSIASIGDTAFGDDSVGSINLNCNITYAGTPDQWDSVTLGYGNTLFSYLVIGSGSCGEHAKWRIADGTLTISGSGKITNISWYDIHTITNVVIEYGVTSIPNYAFSHTGIRSVTIPVSVTAIGSQAFSGCSSLTTLSYGGTPEQWSAIEIADGNSKLTYLYSDNFHGTCGENLTWRYTNGTLTISGKGDMTVDYSEFYNLFGYSLTSVVIEPGVNSIDSLAFNSCSSLTSVSIPASVTTINSSAFGECTNLRNVEYGGTQEQWDNIDFTWGNEMLIYARNGGTVSDRCGENVYWNLTDGVLTITGSGNMYEYDVMGPFSYFGNAIRHVVIADGITNIARHAFSDCGNLVSVQIPVSVTSIQNNVFNGCSSLETITYGGTQEQWRNILLGPDNDSLYSTSIVYSAIPRPTGIQMKLPGFLTTLNAEAFTDSTAMTSVEIPATVTAIESGAFKNCTGLTTVVFNGTAPIIAPDAFVGVTATVYCPEGNASWTASTMQSYGGNPTWVAYVTE